LEDVAAASKGMKIFQLYVHKNRDLARSLIERAKRAGYAALCLTVDVPAMGNRERSMRAGFSMPLVWSLHTVMSYARRPAWVLAQARQGAITLANLEDKGGKGLRDSTAFTDQIDAALTWKDVREISDLWGGPFAIKGMMSVDDARRAADSGVSAVIVSNHGGRQLDGAAAAVEALPEIVRAVGDRIEVILDGGIRRGVHVLKALAMGAKACSIGRPYLYGLSVGGEAGVAKALNILRTELVLAMKLSGCSDVQSIDANIIRRFP
jgi:isopentenyl diphosphate isomerase/L-lactate dehydrogenase-like FMN-dependent dehydrogenase